MREEVLTLRNRLGLHARAAAKFVHIAANFEAKITIMRDRSGQPSGQALDLGCPCCRVAEAARAIPG